VEGFEFGRPGRAIGSSGVRGAAPLVEVDHQKDADQPETEVVLETQIHRSVDLGDRVRRQLAFRAPAARGLHSIVEEQL